MRQTACKTISWLAMVVGWWVFVEADACSAEPPKKPRVDLTIEPLLDQWSAAKAAEYLDVRANADEGTNCLNCHATYAYLPARPWLPAPGTIHTQRRKATEDWAAGLLKEAWSPDVTGDKPVDRKVERRITGGIQLANQPPLWLRMVRWKSNFAVYKSRDGRLWSMISNVSGGPIAGPRSGGPRAIRLGGWR